MLCTLTDAGLDLLATALKDDIWVLLADQVVVLQELAVDAADGVTVAVGGHDCLSCREKAEGVERVVAQKVCKKSKLCFEMRVKAGL